MYSFLSTTELLKVNRLSSTERMYLRKLGRIVQSKRHRPLTYKLDAPEFTREFAPINDNFLDYFFEAGERVHMVIGIDTSDFFKAKVLKHINMQEKFVLDLRFTSKPSLDSLSSILSLKVL
jgi:hypothetical protein